MAWGRQQKERDEQAVAIYATMKLLTFSGLFNLYTYIHIICNPYLCVRESIWEQVCGFYNDDDE